MSRIKELSKEEREYRTKLKQMAQYQLDTIESNFVTSNEFSEGYALTLAAAAQLCIAANLVALTESVEKVTEELAKSKDHGLSGTKEDIYEDNMYLLDDDN